MSSSLFSELRWLPPAPANFSEQVRGLVNTDRPGEHLRRLAAYALDENKLIKLGKAIDKLRSSGRSLSPLVPFRLGVVGNGTLDFIVAALVASAARHGILLECIKGEYDQVMQEVLDPASTINRASPDAVLIALDYRGLPLVSPPGDVDAARDSLAATLDQIAAIRNAIHTNSGAIAIVQTLAPPPEPNFGSFDRVVKGTLRSAIDAVNRDIVASLEGTQDVLLDVAGLAETVGLADWHSPAEWNMAKLPFSSRFVPIYAEHVGRLIGALRGKSRRCLILDLDNTLWGGVIGDDGLDGIVLAQGDPVGESFLTVQRLALTLRERGVVIAVCSKNNDEVAREVFRRHPEMLLREDHIAVFQANWNDKASNIQAIANELSLGLESMVFLDDNPAERALIRRHLPDVAVPEVPDDPTLFARTLSAAGYFESVAFSDEDRKRATFYEENARRVALQAQVGDLAAYLESLKMNIFLRPFDSIGRARIVQLINKSNQFNLTTRRYTEAEIRDLEQDPTCLTLQVRLTDIFGDNGMISAIICRPRSNDIWEIDTWLMSCRVLGRQVETAVLAEILRHANAAGVSRIIGIYRPTERNGLVRNHYEKLGFARIGDIDGGGSEWCIMSNFVVEEQPMIIHREGLSDLDQQPKVKIPAVV